MNNFCIHNNNTDGASYKQINYESDFLLNVTLPTEIVDSGGDFRLVFYTNANQQYSASRTNGQLTDNLHDLGDGMFTVVFRSHNLQTGRLRCKAYYYGKNPLSPDGAMVEVVPTMANVMLVTTKTDESDAPDMNLYSSFFFHSMYEEAVAHGYKGTEDDYYSFINGIPKINKTGRMTFHFSDGSNFGFDVADIESSDDESYDYDAQGIGEFDLLNGETTTEKEENKV